jgi:hypothetical protein
MSKEDKAIQLLESFIDSYTMNGACGAFVVPRTLDEDRGYHVHLYVDRNWIGKQEVRPHLVAKKLRDTLQKNCKDYTGIDVYVTSSAKTCDEVDNLSESMAPHVKRRLSNVKLLEELTTILEYEINLSYYENAADAVEEIIDLLNERILDEIRETTNRKVSLKEKDELYWYLHNKFGRYIGNKFNEQMGVNESKNKYIVTESQYNLILESQKKINFFQEIIDNKLDVLREECEGGADVYVGNSSAGSCDQIESIDKVEVTDADWVTIKHSNRPQEEKYMSVKIMIYYSSIRKGDLDADDLTYDLERMIRLSTGMPFILNYESTNTNKSFEW